MDKVLFWGLLLVGSAIVPDRMEKGCKSCGGVLSLLEALRSATCPGCERALGSTAQTTS